MWGVAWTSRESVTRTRKRNSVASGVRHRRSVNSARQLRSRVMAADRPPTTPRPSRRSPFAHRKSKTTRSVVQGGAVATGDRESMVAWRSGCQRGSTKFFCITPLLFSIVCGQKKGIVLYILVTQNLFNRLVMKEFF